MHPFPKVAIFLTLTDIPSNQGPSMPKCPRFFSLSMGLLLSFMTPAPAGALREAEPAADPDTSAKKEATWDVTAPHGPSRQIEFETGPNGTRFKVMIPMSLSQEPLLKT